MTPRRRLLAFAGGLTLLVGALGGVVGAVIFSADPSASPPEVWVGQVVVGLLLTVVVLLYVVVPVGVAAALAREHGHPLVYGAAALAAVAVPVVAPVALLWTVEEVPVVETGLLRLVAAVAGVAAVLGGGLLFRRVAPATEGTGWVLGLNLAVVFLFLLGFLGVQVAAPGFADRHTTDTRPDVELEFGERTTDDGRIVVVEHAGGEPAPADRLEIDGEGFADVEGADQTGPGPWAGEATGRAPRHDGPAVVEGDTVTVGVTDDCRLRVGTEADFRAALGYYDCSEAG